MIVRRCYTLLLELMKVCRVINVRVMYWTTCCRSHGYLMHFEIQIPYHLSVVFVVSHRYYSPFVMKLLIRINFTVLTGLYLPMKSAKWLDENEATCGALINLTYSYLLYFILLLLYFYYHFHVLTPSVSIDDFYFNIIWIFVAIWLRKTLRMSHTRLRRSL